MSLERLKSRLDQKMGDLARQPGLTAFLAPGFADRRLYAIYLIETYHYALHNSRNQAMVAARPDAVDIRYAKYCLKHAMEEVGHEQMAVADLRAIGVDRPEAELPRPMGSTQALIAYLYRTAEYGNPLARLGYSYWAERAYDYMKPMLQLMSGKGVGAAQMTFLGAHAAIDVAHAKEVDEAVTRFARTDEDWRAIEETLSTSLDLTAAMLGDVIRAFVALKEGRPSPYEFLNALLPARAPAAAATEAAPA